jgi:diacylglycerol kinase (ATP)
VTRRPILLLANPAAGGKVGSGPHLDPDPARLEPESLAGELRGRGLEVQLRVLGPQDDATQLAREAAAGGADVVVAGGDGTVGAAAVALLGDPNASLGILARGSFNNIARGYGIPVTLDEAVAVIEGGETRSVDAGWVYREDPASGRPFFEAVGVGVDAIAFLAIEIAGRRGWWRALRALWRGVRRRRTRMLISLDGKASQIRSPSVTIHNGPFHGPGMAVAVDADPADGWLNVAIFSRMTSIEVLRHFLRVARRRPRREPRVRVLRARTITVESLRRALPAHADGVSIGVTPITVEIRPGSLRVFAPRRDGA